MQRAGNPFDKAYKAYKKWKINEKIFKELDAEFLECYINFCIHGENILMYDLVEDFVEHIFNQCFCITDELVD